MSLSNQTKVIENRIFVNSLPKSGTHLLTKAVEIFGYQEYSSNRGYIRRLFDYSGFSLPKFFNYRQAKQSLKKQAKNNNIEEKISIGALTPYYVNPETVRYWLKNIPQGQYIQGHIPWTSALTPILTELNYRHLIIIRDPRAVVASLIPFVLNASQSGMGAHFLEADFKSMSRMQRLNFVLEGGYAPQAAVTVQSFHDVYHSILAWRNQPNCLFIRFEDLVGEQGGGSFQQQENLVRSIALYLGIEFDENRLKEIYDPSARTFRMGKIDGWKKSLNSEEIERVTAYCEPLCKEAGYD